MNRRLMHYVPRQLRHRPADHHDSLDTTELWFLPVANPDGYDFTFTAGNRLWRKNLRDNNGDGADHRRRRRRPQPQLRLQVGLRQRGLVAATRRARPTAARPRLRAGDQGAGRPASSGSASSSSSTTTPPPSCCSTASAGRSAPRRPDDVIYEAMAGDDAHPAVPGYDPDISAELYTTNGEHRQPRHDRYGTLGFTPEMSTCEAASRRRPGRPVATRRTASAASTSPTTRR